ncbi:unnamed protein product, partial [Prorocentrum cordatum]
MGGLQISWGQVCACDGTSDECLYASVSPTACRHIGPCENRVTKKGDWCGPCRGKRHGGLREGAFGAAPGERGDPVERVLSGTDAFESLPPGLREDREVVMRVVSHRGAALASVGTQFQNDVGVVREALRNDGFAWAHVPQGLREDESVLQELLGHMEETGGDHLPDEWEVLPANARVRVRDVAAVAKAVSNQHERDRNRMNALRHLCPEGSLREGLRNATGKRFAIPSASECKSLVALAKKYKLKEEFVHLKCVWLVHVAAVMSRSSPQGFDDSDRAAASCEAGDLLLESLCQPCLRPSFERGISNGRITALGTFGRRRGQFAAGSVSPVPDVATDTLATRVLRVCRGESFRSSDVFATWVFYDLVFRFCADIDGFEALLEVTGGLLKDVPEWIRRARIVISECPHAEYFWGSANDGRRSFPLQIVRRRLDELHWKPIWAGSLPSDTPVSRVLAFVAFLGDWHVGASRIAESVLAFKANRTELASAAQEIALDYCLPGFSHAGDTRRFEYYWPKFPFSDLVLYAQESMRLFAHDRKGLGGRLHLPQRNVEALAAVTFNGRGGRLPLLAFDMEPSCAMFKKLRDLDKDLLVSRDLPIRGLWQRGGCVDPEHLTAYDPQVVNCMLWKHDVCVLSPPNQRFVGVSLQLD